MTVAIDRVGHNLHGLRESAHWDNLSPRAPMRVGFLTLHSTRQGAPSHPVLTPVRTLETFRVAGADGLCYHFW
jgi:hypothetical protein